MIFSYEFLPGYLFQVFDNDIHSLLHGIKLILLVLCQFAYVTEVVNRNIYITRSTAFVSQCSGKLSNFFADAEVVVYREGLSRPVYTLVSYGFTTILPSSPKV